ncbi:MAG: hypothetical protein NTX21_06130 [Alphaproteobacteria bacterium]|nr:hypothetical protein [Alphaproteobacteria bacterium]
MINLLQGLSNLLPKPQQQPPSPPVAYALIATPPPVMPATSP